MTTLADIITSGNHRGRLDLRIGVVTAASGNRVTVDIGGTAVPDLPRLATYTPATGDRAVVLVTADRAAVVIGCIARTETP